MPYEYVIQTSILMRLQRDLFWCPCLDADGLKMIDSYNAINGVYSAAVNSEKCDSLWFWW